MKEMGCREKKRNQCHADTYQKLHEEGPPSFGLDQIDKRTPEWLHNPWQIDPSGLERHVGLGDPEISIHQHCQRVDCEIGEALRNVDSRNPSPGRFSPRDWI